MLHCAALRCTYGSGHSVAELAPLTDRALTALWVLTVHQTVWVNIVNYSHPSANYVCPNYALC